MKRSLVKEEKHILMTILRDKMLPIKVLVAVYWCLIIIDEKTS